MEVKEILECLEKMHRWEKEGIAPAEDTNAYVMHVIEDIVSKAEELGMHHEHAELQELCVKLGFPEDYKKIYKLREESEMMCENVFQTFAMPIRAMLDAQGIEYDFKYRMKSIYSIWRKMRIDHKEFDDVYDLFATRIVYKPKDIIEPLPFATGSSVDTLPDASLVKQWQMAQLDTEKFYCWRIYTIISMLYRIHPDRTKDWVTHPKPSGYQALQMTVMGPDCNWIEIQLRSERMDYEAEEGAAAHWKYKQETHVS